MIPRLGKKSDLEIIVVSKPRADYSSEEHTASGRPKAPAITIDDEVIVAGCDIAEQDLEAAIKQYISTARG